MNQLSAWGNFYMIVGSAGAALIGIQFVVIALIADIHPRPTADSINAFGTPNVVHFASVLLVSAIMCVPWTSLSPVSAVLAICGFSGLAYGAIVIRRARRQTSYEPVGEDWFWYAICPSSVYAALAVSAVFLRTTSQCPMFVIGAAALGLLLIGIHNAWDSVTHIVITSSHGDSKKTK